MQDFDPLLRTSLEGEPCSYDELRSEGYYAEDRRPRVAGLESLLQHGSPMDRWLAARLLLAWGERAGYEQLKRWIHGPVPWQPGELSCERWYGADDTFEQLMGDVTNTDELDDPPADLGELRREAFRALMSRVSDVWLGRTPALAYAAFPEDFDGWEEEAAADVRGAVDAGTRAGAPAWLTFQAAALLPLLARSAPDQLLAHAQTLLDYAEDSGSVAREVGFVLKQNVGAAAGPLLRRLAASTDSYAAEPARDALAKGLK